MDPLSIGMGVVSAVSSLVGDSIEQSAARKAKADAVNAFKKLLIPTSETEIRADRAGDTLYTKTMGELNSGAFAARGALNPETLKTIAYTKMAGARATTEQNVYDQDFGMNRQVQSKIAEIEAQPIPTIDPFNAVEAGVGGYLAGEQLSMAQDLNAQYASLMDLQKQSLGGGKGKSGNVSDIFNFGMDRISDFKVPKVGFEIPEKKNINFGFEPENYNKIDAFIDIPDTKFSLKKKKNNWLGM